MADEQTQSAGASAAPEPGQVTGAAGPGQVAGAAVPEPGQVAGAAVAEPGPKKRRSVFFLAGSLATGNGVSMVLRMVGGLLMGRLVAPATLGLFNGIGLVIGYIPFMQLGILSGLNRELPFFIGKGDRERAYELAAVAQAWALLLGGIVFVALTGVSGWELAHGQPWKAAGWFANAISGAYLFYASTYLQVTFRTSHDFARLAVINVINAAVALAALAIVVVLNFYGLCIRSILISVITTAFLFKWGPIRVKPRWNFGHWKHLLRIGAPIFAVGQVFAWWATLNSTLVLKLAGTKGMGLYSMVLLAGSALDVVPTSVSQVLYPRMAEEYGRNGTARALLRILRKPVTFTFLGMIPVVAVGWVVIHPFMRIVVPNYVDAVPAARWALFLVFVSALMPVTSVFNVVRRQDLYATAVVVGIAAYTGALFWLIRGGNVHLAAFSQAMLIGRLVFIALCYVFAWRLRNKTVAIPKAQA